MKCVQCYELFDGIALKNHAFQPACNFYIQKPHKFSFAFANQQLNILATLCNNLVTIHKISFNEGELNPDLTQK